MNPITLARINAGISKSEFSRKVNLSRTWVLRAEEGCYSNPGSKLVNFTCETLMISKSEFNRRYQGFQKEVRTKSTELLEPIKVEHRVDSADLDDSVKRVLSKTTLETAIKMAPVGFMQTSSENPIEITYMHQVFKKWRMGYFNAVIAFSRALCVHPSSVEQYESGSYDSMPVLLMDALKEVKLLDESFDPYSKWCYVYAEG